MSHATWAGRLTPPTTQQLTGVQSIARDLDIEIPSKIKEEALFIEPELERPVITQEVKSRRNIFLEFYDRAIEKRKARLEHEALEESSKLAIVRRVTLRVISIFASLSCAATSVYFSNRWFIASQPPFIAAIMAVTIVATLTVAPELAISLARKRRYLTALVITAISVVATVFSMSSTVGGIYDLRSEELVRQASEDGDGAGVRAELDSARAELSLLEGTIERHRVSVASEKAQVDSYQKAIDALLTEGEDPNSVKMRTLVANRSNAIVRARNAESALSKAESEYRAVLPRASLGALDASIEASAEREDFNLWLGKRFGLSQDTMEFIMAALPAVFIDVIAPAMLVVAFSL